MLTLRRLVSATSVLRKATTRVSSGRSSPAFTIVELLIVIVIIAILAAITVVAFNGIQARARASAVSAALNQASKKLELYSIDNGGYPAALADAGVANANDITYQYTAGTAPSATYCTTATQGTTSYYISDTTKTPTVGGCPGHGQGGVAAITNLATNPSLEVNTTTWSTNWGTSGAGTASRVTTGAYAGAAAYRMAWSATPTVTWGGSRVGPFATVSGGTYSAAVWVKTSRAQPMYMFARPNTWPTNADIRGSAVNVPANTWTRLTDVLVIPAGVGSVSMSVECTSSGSWQAGDILDSDAFILVEGGVMPNYADGNSPNWVWNGSANASTSTGPAL